MRWFREYSNRISNRSSLKGKNLKALVGACIYITIFVNKMK